MKREDASRPGSGVPPNHKPPQVAANNGGPKEQHKDDKRPNAKKDPKKEGKKEHEGEPGR